MKILSLLTLLSVVFSVNAATFSLGSKMNPAQVKVEKQGETILISCRFKAQKKFSPSRNAQMNDRKADNLCRQGLALYLQNNNITLSGITSAGPHKDYGKDVEYYFSMPAAELQTAATISAQKQKVVAEAPRETAKRDKTNNSMKPEVVNNKSIPSSGSYKNTLTIIRYNKQNGVVKVIETSEYRSQDFKTPQEFNSFCNQQFARIDEHANENMAAVVKRFEKERKRIEEEFYH